MSQRPMRGPMRGHGMMPGEKAKDFKGSTLRLLSYMGKFRFALIGVLLFGKKIQTSVANARNKNGALGALLTGVMSMAIIEALLPMQMIKGPVHLAVAATACLLSFLQRQFVRATGLKWYRSFIMSVTLILGMASSLFWVQVLG